MRKPYEKSGRFRCKPAVNVSRDTSTVPAGGVSTEGRHFDKAIAADVSTELVDAGCGSWSVRAPMVEQIPVMKWTV
jgi:hypothetical protein